MYTVKTIVVLDKARKISELILAKRAAKVTEATARLEARKLELQDEWDNVWYRRLWGAMTGASQGDDLAPKWKWVNEEIHASVLEVELYFAEIYLQEWLDDVREVQTVAEFCLAIGQETMSLSDEQSLALME